MQRLTILALLLLHNSTPAADPKLPHILCIMADDLGWMDLGCQGNPVLHTPNLDQLAASGMRFTNAYAAAPVCSPTRAAIMTGLAPARLRITQHGADGPQFHPEDRRVQPPRSNPELNHDTTTIAEHLKDAGYQTAFFGKWHLGNPKEYWPQHHGFDLNIGGCGFGGPPTYFDPYRIPSLPNRREGEYLTDRLADEVIDYIGQKHQQPMFICLWTYNPHYPFEAPEELTKPYSGREGRGLKNPIYGGQISALDRAVGRVLAALKEHQIEDETLVIFTSDNGGWSGATDNRPLRAGKGFLYEGGIRVPLLVRWPGVTTAKTESSQPVISMDLTATILDATGRNSAAGRLDGVSLRPALQQKELNQRSLYFHYPHFAFHKDNQPGAAIRSGQYKLIHRFADQSVELFDLEIDEQESTNIAEQQPDTAMRLKNELIQWLELTDAALPTSI